MLTQSVMSDSLRSYEPASSLSMVFSSQEYWSGMLFPFPGELPDPGIKPVSPTLAGELFPTEPPGKPTITPTHLQMIIMILLL